ncbi:YdcF family protein [Lutibaculum baratangense]|uniref:DUF218 domain-containing protein n=1 Tax=Lutibaculum baratangense AMV1 TaxID=631454 RepID=V4RCQ2_9HYPH|nr:YdcF family protein [Lutibaculum baratangense]ESR23906.1 hypothetical protein N177_2851 [Lutibaculum baratangense AMV1]
MRWLLLALAGGVCILVMGFASFVSTVTDLQKPALPERADAIVALTGGAARISDALRLLDEGRATRLLISGVNPDTTQDELKRVEPHRDQLFGCCVDLGYSALNTAGNAEETRNWTRDRGYRSLIVVTSAYHLPRSLTEIRRELPDVWLIPYPVVTDHLQLSRWWRDPKATRLLVSEYAKYLLAVTKLRFGRPATAAEAPPIGDR